MLLHLTHFPHGIEERLHDLPITAADSHDGGADKAQWWVLLQHRERERERARVHAGEREIVCVRER